VKREPRLSGLRRTFSLPPSSKRLDQEIDEEIRFHIDSHIADLVARGVAPSVARERALQHYGDVMESRRELTRVDRARLTRMRWSSTFDAVRQDVGFALRTFRTKPAFAFASVIVLALGIGANATMFGVIDRLLFRPPAHIADPATLMTAHYTRVFRGDVDSQNALSFPMYVDLVNTPAAFRDVAAYTSASLTIGRGASARLVSANRVTANYFRTLGVRPRLGRFFAADEDGAPTAPNLAVVSYAYWTRELNSDDQVLGRTLPIGGAKYTIIGVAPAGFTGVSTDPVELWVPLTAGVSAAEYEIWKSGRTNFWLLCVARLAPGVSRAAAADAATRVLRAQTRLAGASEQHIAEERPAIAFVSVLPREANAGQSSARVAALLGAVSVLVLLIACANVANL
jgi:putative ABC transport system permease protein